MCLHCCYSCFSGHTAHIIIKQDTDMAMSKWSAQHHHHRTRDSTPQHHHHRTRDSTADTLQHHWHVPVLSTQNCIIPCYQTGCLPPIQRPWSLCKTCVATKFVDDDDDDSHSPVISSGWHSSFLSRHKTATDNMFCKISSHRDWLYLSTLLCDLHLDVVWHGSCWCILMQ